MSRYGDGTKKQITYDALCVLCYDIYDKSIDDLTDEEKLDFIGRIMYVITDEIKNYIFE